MAEFPESTRGMGVWAWQWSLRDEVGDDYEPCERLWTLSLGKGRAG